MRGNCATGKLKMVSVPTSTRTIEITMATMGRLIKNFDIGLFSRSFHEWLGVHLHSRTCLLHTLSNHSFARLQSVGDYPLIAETIADLDRSNAHFVLVIHRRDLITALQLRDCTLGHQQCVL